MIEVEQVTKRYGKDTAVDELSFAVQPGRVTGFLGPNGAGKSTTMRLILGLDRADSGRCRVQGREYAGHRYPLHEVGALLDARAVHGGRSAYRHLLALAQSNRIPRRRVDAVLGLVGLESVRNKMTGGFSLGMSQRLGIAAALLGDPPILLFDEPINGLDPEGIQWIRGLLRRLAAEGRTVFISSHLMSEMAVTADHLVVVGRGRLIADAGVGELLAASQSGFLSVRSPGGARLIELLRGAGGLVTVEADGALQVRGLSAEVAGELAAEHGITLHELATHAASLETAFFELTGAQSQFQAGSSDTDAPATDQHDDHGDGRLSLAERGSR